MEIEIILAFASVWVPAIMFILSLVLTILAAFGMIVGPLPSWDPEPPQTLVGTAYTQSSMDRWEEYRRSEWMRACKLVLIVAMLLLAGSMTLPAFTKLVSDL
jgi:hypothetical protein